MNKELYTSKVDQFVKALKEVDNLYLKDYLMQCKQFFEKYPEVLHISFNIYYPYFNDGDACIPAMQSYQVKFSEEIEETLGSHSEEYGYFIDYLYCTDNECHVSLDSFNRENLAFKEGLHDALYYILSYAKEFEDLWIRTYGNHCTVVIGADLSIKNLGCVVSHD